MTEMLQLFIEATATYFNTLKRKSRQTQRSRDCVLKVQRKRQRKHNVILNPAMHYSKLTNNFLLETSSKKGSTAPEGLVYNSIQNCKRVVYIVVYSSFQINSLQNSVQSVNPKSPCTKVYNLGNVT